jgi:hypothetical protein
MGMMTMSESEVKLFANVKELEQRIITVERKLDALNMRLEGGARHPEDEGWFD